MRVLETKDFSSFHDKRKLSEEELRELRTENRRLLNILYKRGRRMKERYPNEYNPTYGDIEKDIKRGKLKTSVADLTKRQLLSQNRKLRYYLNQNASTIQSYKQLRRAFSEVYEKLDYKHQKRFWSIYKEVRERNFYPQKEKYKIVQAIVYGILAKMTRKDLIHTIETKIDQVYVKYQERLQKEYEARLKKGRGKGLEV